MKKTLIISLLALFAVSATAAGTLATLINSKGEKVVVESGTSQAQSYFGNGYVLMGTPLAPKTETIVEKVCDCSDLIGGQVSTSRQFFRGGATTGGSYFATTSTLTTKTLTPTELGIDRSYINWLPNKDITLTLTATATVALIPNIGDTSEVFFRNASTTSGTITFAADATGLVDLAYNESTGGDLVLDEEGWARITFIRKTATSIGVLFDEFIED